MQAESSFYCSLHLSLNYIFLNALKKPNDGRNSSILYIDAMLSAYIIIIMCFNHTSPVSMTRHNHFTCFSQICPWHKTVPGTYSFADRRTLVCFIRSLLLGKLTAGFQSTVINGLKNLLVQVLGLRTFKGVSHQNESICQTLHTNANGTMASVGAFSLQKE